MKRRIEIRNVGPIEDVSFELNRVNVISGPSSCGKRTVAKIISFCLFVEEDIALTQSVGRYGECGDFQVRFGLEHYWHLDGYFNNPDALVVYESDVISFTIKGRCFMIPEWVDKYAFKRSKMCYIPSERNCFYDTKIRTGNFFDGYYRSFINTLMNSIGKYTLDSKLPVPGFDVSLWYDEKNDEIHVSHINELNPHKNYTVPVMYASSSIKSAVPVISAVDYYTGRFFTDEPLMSYDDLYTRNETVSILMEELVFKKYFGTLRKNPNEEREEIETALLLGGSRACELMDDLKRTEENIFSFHNAHFIIENVEQSLTREQEKILIHYLLDSVLETDDNRFPVKRGHSLTVTTSNDFFFEVIRRKKYAETLKGCLSTLELE